MESTPTVTTSSTGAGHGGASVLLFPMPGAQGHLNPADAPVRPPPRVPRPPPHPRVHPLPSLHHHASRGPLPRGRHLRRRQCRLPGHRCLHFPAGGRGFRDAAAREGRPVRVLVYDPHLAWAPRVARAAGVPTAAFFSQPCAVNIIYGELWAGRLALPVTEVRALVEKGAVSMELGPEDVPPFVAALEMSPGLRKASVGQFEGLEEADDVLVNSFSDMEPKEAKYMESTWRAKMIGPTLPSFYLDDHRSPSNKSYGFNLFGGVDSCMDWMDKQTINSVVLVSYGTFSQYNVAQLEELGNGLCNSGKPFLWVVRSNESHKLSEELKTKCGEKGLIVSWCPQLAVLAHKSIGCFVTHCGWNSTLEAIVCGVPLVGIPHWADQPTIAKYVQSVWCMGVRAQHGDNGWIKREEVDRCIREVMDGERKDEYRKNAAKWMKKAKEATREGGSSDKNIHEFAAKYSSI